MGGTTPRPPCLSAPRRRAGERPRARRRLRRVGPRSGACAPASAPGCCSCRALGFLLVYDITKEESFHDVRAWITRINTYAWENAQVLFSLFFSLSFFKAQCSNQREAFFLYLHTPYCRVVLTDCPEKSQIIYSIFLAIEVFLLFLRTFGEDEFQKNFCVFHSIWRKFAMGGDISDISDRMCLKWLRLFFDQPN